MALDIPKRGATSVCPIRKPEIQSSQRYKSHVFHSQVSQIPDLKPVTGVGKYIWNNGAQASVILERKFYFLLKEDNSF